MKKTNQISIISTSYFKKIIRRYNIVNRLVWFLYSRVIYFSRTLRARYIHLLIISLKKLVIKKDIKGLSFTKDKVTLELTDKAKFYWKVNDRTSLLGLGLSGIWEPEETDFLRTLIRPGEIVVDVGANYGYYTVLFSKLVGSEGKVHSFEPLPEAYHELQRNILLNNIENTVINKYALGEKSRRAKIYIVKGWGTGSATLRNSANSSVGSCQVVLLDAYVKQQKVKKINFIKLDIEGGEMSALKGSIETIKKFSPSLMIEVTRDAYQNFGYTTDDLYSFLDKFGYFCYFVSRGKLTRLSQFPFSHYHGNFFAFPKKK